MWKSAALFILPASVLFASPANAGWQWTDWGMTLEQVAAAAPAAAVSDNSFRFTGGGIEFVATMIADSGGLSRVVLVPVKQGQCQAVQDALRQTYGRSETGEDAWRDEPHGTSVRLVDMSYTDCSVVYEPIRRGGQQGGL